MKSSKSIDLWIRAGQFQKACAQFEEARTARELTPVEEAVFLRRLGRFEEGINCLRPLLFQDSELKKNAPDETKIEYANHLTFLGLTSEARFHLKRVLELKGFAYFFAEGLFASTIGDFEAARASFQKASLARDASDYDRIVANSNLLNALLGCFQYDEVIKLGDDLLNALDPLEHRNLYAWRASCVSQAHAYQKNSSLFSKEIKRCLDTFQINSQKEPQNAFELNQLRFSPIGKLHCQSLSPSETQDELKRLRHYQKIAHTYGEWQAFRDLSIHTAFFEKKAGVLIHAYYGSPSSFQKTRIRNWLKLLGEKLPSTPPLLNSKSIAYGNQNAGAGSGRVTRLDLNLGNSELDPEKLPIKMMKALLNDLYRPVRTHELHDLVWGDSEFFSPLHSPSRVHQVLNRLKRELKTSKINFTIHSVNDRYFVGIGAGLSIVPSDLQTPAFLSRWNSSFKDAWVRIEKVAKVWNATPRSIQLKIKERAQDFDTRKEGNQRYYRLPEVLRPFW